MSGGVTDPATGGGGRSTPAVVRWTVIEFAQHCGVHRWSVYRWIASGRLRAPYRAIKDPGGQGWWIVADLNSLNNLVRPCTDISEGP